MVTISRGARQAAPPASVNSGLGITGTTGDAVDPFGGLEGADRDAYAALANQLKAWGLEGLAPVVMGYIKNGYSNDTISLLLPQTPEYKQRFAANDARARAGLPVLSPGEYLSVEQSYRQLMSAAGLPVGFYDSPDDFTSWIANDVSPTEVQQRVQVASDLVNSADESTKNYFKQFYSHGDMVAYALDRTKAAPLIEQQLKAAQVGGAAAKQGLNVGQGLVEDLAKQGVTQQQALAGFGFIAQESPTVAKLASIYDESPLTTEDLINETFMSDAGVADKRKRLASRERASFNGSSAASKTSLSRESAGQL